MSFLQMGFGSERAETHCFLRPQNETIFLRASHADSLYNGSHRNPIQMKRLAILSLLLSATQICAQTQPAVPAPDSRFKADVLVVIAHPDDDTALSTFLAKAVFDEG